MPLPNATHQSCCEIKGRTARLSFGEWTFQRKFRVITLAAQPPRGPIWATQCEGIPPYFSSYVDFSTGELVPNALLHEYVPEETGNVREWIINCEYSTNLPTAPNSGGLQSPNTPNQPGGGGGGGGSSNPNDPTQLLPKLSRSVEIAKVPYKFDPQDDAVFKDANGNLLMGGFRFSRFCNTAGENYAAGAFLELPLQSYNVGIYYATDADPTTHSSTVNNGLWSGKVGGSWLCKPWTTSREKFGSTWYWLRNYSFVYDPIFFHRFTVLNAGFRQLENPVAPNNAFTARKLIDIVTGTPAVRTSVEWPLNLFGQPIIDPGQGGANLIYGQFNKFPKSNFSTIGAPFPFQLNQAFWFVL